MWSCDFRFSSCVNLVNPIWPRARTAYCVCVLFTMASWGGSREGAGRKKKTTNKAEKRVRLRISEGLYHRWTELKNLRKARNDEEAFSYLLDLAREVDQGPVTR